MSFFNICFTKNSVKSQPEVGLSQDLFDFEQLNHGATVIPIPSSNLPSPSNGLDSLSGLDIYDVSSFGSFSSAADSLVLDKAIVIPSYDPSSLPTTNIQDFYIFGDRDPLLQPPSSSHQHDMSIFPSSSCKSDLSFCSTLADDMLMIGSPNESSTDWPPMESSPFDFHPPPSSTVLFGPTTTVSPRPVAMDQLFTNLPLLDAGTALDLHEEGTSTQDHHPSTIKKRSSRRREYECPYCARKSNRSNNMKEHILTHDPNRPKNFNCTFCPKRFARKHDLKRHHQAHERCIEKIMVACGIVPLE